MDPTLREGVGRLAINLFGADALAYDEGQLEPVLIDVRRHRIFLRADVDRPVLTMAIARGVAMLWAALVGLEPPVTVDLLAPELAIPEAALIEAIEDVGEDIGALALAFVCPVATVAEHVRFQPARTRSGRRLRAESA
jgi:hypothetical protein